MRKLEFIYKLPVLLSLLIYSNTITAQKNVGILATAAHSGGGSGSISGPVLYNDNVIPPPGGLPSGFVTTGGWIEFTWTVPQTFNKIIFHKGSGIMSSCVLEYWNGSSYTTITNYNSNVSPNDAITFLPVTATKFRMNNIVAVSGNPRFREIQVLNAYNNDIGIVAIDSTNKSFCSGTKNVYATITNMGLNQVTNCTINWTVNGVVQTPVTYSGLIDTFRGANLDTVHVKLGTIPGLPNTSYLIKAWTSDPNGQADPWGSNDTALGTLRAALSGTYTIGSGGNYPSFFYAVTDLSNYGVCGPVTFNVRTNTYNEQVLVGAIQGVSPTNTITFQSAANDPDSVILNYPVTNTANYIFKLNNASYINIKNLSFKPMGSAYANMIVFGGNSSNDSILTCKISSASVTSGFASLEQCGIYGTSLSGSNIVISGNTISGGSYGIYLYGVTSPRGNNYRIYDNIILNSYNYGILCNYINRVKVINNRVSLNVPVYTSCYGITCQSCDTEILVSNNNIIANAGSATVYGLNMTSCFSSVSQPGLVLNNSIAVTSTGPTYGLYSNIGSNFNYYNNSVNSNSVNATNYAAYFNHSNSNESGINFKNNIFANSGGGKALYNKNIVNAIGDYNDLFSTGNILVERGSPAGNFNTLTDWKTASVQELNSIAYRPPYTGNTDLQPNPSDTAAWSINGRGIQMSGNNVDMNGNSRSTTLAAGVPDLGAYEFTPISQPPAAIVVPLVAVPGASQYFTFGEDTVARIDWGNSSAIPANLVIRQYSGQKPPLLNIPSYMYFYIGVEAANGSYNYTINPFYRHTWLGTNPSEKALKLAKKESNVPWAIFTGTQSTVDSIKRTISGYSTALPCLFTGIDSLAVIPICTAPSGLSASNVKDVSADINWNSVLNINGYEYFLSQSPTPPASGSLITNTNRSLSGLTNNTTYYFHLRTACSNGDFSNWITQSFTTVSCSTPNAVVTNSRPLTFCQGDSTVLSVTSGVGYTYQWKQGGNNIVGATGASYAVKSSGSYTVEIINGICTASSSAVVVNVGAVNASITVLAGSTTFCEGSPCTFRASLGMGQTYQWQLNGRDIPGATNSIYLPDSAGNYTVKISNGTCTGVSAPATVTIIPMPDAKIVSVQGNRNGLCKGDSVVLTANTGNGLSYQWTTSGVDIPGATGLTYVVQYSGHYAVKVTHQTCTNRSVDTTITINLLPLANITAQGDSIFCQGDSVLLDAYVGNNGYFYRWKNNGATISGASNGKYIARVSGDYSVVVTTNGCADSSANYNVLVHPLPIPVVSSGDGVNLSTGNYLTYQWSLGGIEIPGAISKDYKALVDGDYTVSVTDSNGCTNTSQVYHAANVYVDNIYKLASNVKLYPNPTTDIVQVITPMEVNISIYSLAGKLLLHTSNTKTIDLRELANGIYVIKLTDTDGLFIHQEKIVKLN